MENSFAKFVTYAAHLVDGNVVTDLMSIGEKTPKTGPDPPAPAIVGGLNTHAVFEGDASITRGWPHPKPSPPQKYCSLGGIRGRLFWR